MHNAYELWILPVEICSAFELLLLVRFVCVCVFCVFFSLKSLSSLHLWLVSIGSCKSVGRFVYLFAALYEGICDNFFLLWKWKINIHSLILDNLERDKNYTHKHNLKCTCFSTCHFLIFWYLSLSHQRNKHIIVTVPFSFLFISSLFDQEKSDHKKRNYGIIIIITQNTISNCKLLRMQSVAFLFFRFLTVENGSNHKYLAR